MILPLIDEPRPMLVAAASGAATEDCRMGRSLFVACAGRGAIDSSGLGLADSRPTAQRAPGVSVLCGHRASRRRSAHRGGRVLTWWSRPIHEAVARAGGAAISSGGRRHDMEEGKLLTTSSGVRDTQDHFP